jgi:hypothetical protein
MRSIAAIVFALGAVAIFQGCSSEDGDDNKKIAATGGGTATGGSGTGSTPASGGAASSTGGAPSAVGSGGQPACPATAAYCPGTGSGTPCCVGNSCGTDLGMGCVMTTPDAN